MTAACPHCGGAIPTPASTTHRGELERQLGDVMAASDLRKAAERSPESHPAPLWMGFIAWRGYVWAPCRTRKPATCWLTGAEIPAGAAAYRQLSEVRDRDRRVSAAAWAHLA